MDFLRRQLRYRNYRFGLFAVIVTGAYLALVLASLLLIVYVRLFPDPEEVGATFELVPAIIVTSPLSMALLTALEDVDFGVGPATLLLMASGLAQAAVLYVVLRGWRRRMPRAVVG